MLDIRRGFRPLRPSAGRRGVAPTPPLAVRLILLALLPVIGLGIYLDGQRYAPDKLDFGKGAQNVEAKLFPDRLGGLARAGKVRSFAADTLYEYINGHAEHFLSAGFKGLAVAEYGTDPTRPSLVVNLYDLGTPLNAFGVLVDEAAQQESVDIGTLGFRGGQGLSFIHGPYYAQINGFDASAPLEVAARSLADRLTEAVPAGDLGFDFPDLGKVESTRFVREAYRGLDFLERVLERTFDVDGRPVQVFLVSGGAEKVRSLLESLSAFMTEEGISVERIERSGVALSLVHDPYEGEWFYLALGDRLLGVFAPFDKALETEILRFVSEERPLTRKGDAP